MSEAQQRGKGTISFIRLLVPPNSIVIIFAIMAFLGASAMWLGGALYFESSQKFLTFFKTGFIAAFIQLGILTLFVVKMVRFRPRYRSWLCWASAFYLLIYVSLLVRAWFMNLPGELWYTVWGGASGFAWWVFQSQLMSRFLKGIENRYEAIHGKNPYQELADHKTQKSKEKR